MYWARACRRKEILIPRTPHWCSWIAVALVASGLWSNQISIKTRHAQAKDVQLARTLSSEEWAEELMKEEKDVVIEKVESNYTKELKAKPKMVAKSSPKPTPANKPTKTESKVTYASRSSVNKCSCVLFVKQKYGIDPGSVGAARNWPITTKNPKTGSVVVTAEGPIGHVGYVTAVDETNIYINDANYSTCQETNRTLPKNSPVIRGYYN